MAAKTSDLQKEIPEISDKGPCSAQMLHLLANAAHKARAVLHAAEALTERHTLTAQDRMALDGLLQVGREFIEELLSHLEQMAAQPAYGPQND